MFSRRDPQKGPVWLVGSYGHGNLGDDLLQAELGRRVRLALPGVEVQALSLGAVRHPLPEGIPTSSVRLKQPVPTARTLGSALIRGRALIIGAGGLVSDRYPGVVIALAALAAAARARGLPVGLIGVGVDSLAGRLPPSALALICRAARVITVRDEASLLALPEFARDRARVASDLAWGRPPVTPSATRRGVVVSLRPWSPWALERVLAQVELELRARQEAHPGEPISLLPMDLALDPPVLQALARRIPDLSPRLLDPGDAGSAEAALAGAEAVLAMRFHAGLLGARHGASLLLFPYAGKVRSLAASLGVPGWEPSEDPGPRGFGAPRLKAIEAAVRSVEVHGEAVAALLGGR